MARTSWAHISPKLSPKRGRGRGIAEIAPAEWKPGQWPEEAGASFPLLPLSS